MRILVSNDDGIHAPGIKSLVKALAPLGEIYVAAPAVEQTAKGHSITIHQELKVQEISYSHAVKAYKIWGTPKDCVDLALSALLDFTPDLIATGINRGSNICNDCVSSGTIGGATAGFLRGIPSIAYSLDFGREFDYDIYAEHVLDTASWFVKQKFSRDFVLSVNLPNTGEINGTVVATTGARRTYHGQCTVREEDGFKYYTYPFNHPELVDIVEDLDHDAHALANGYIVLQPMDYDLVRQDSVAFLRNKWNER